MATGTVNSGDWKPPEGYTLTNPEEWKPPQGYALMTSGNTPQVESSIRYLTTEDYQPPTEPGMVERFGKQYASVLGVPDLLDIIRGSNRYGTPQEVAARGEKAKTALGHVVAGLRDEPARVGGELVGIVQSMLDPKQNTADMSMHMLGAIPMLGPNLQGFVHDVWSKKYPEAAADLAALATLTKGPKVIEAAGEALPRVTQAVETVPAVVTGAVKGGWQGATGPTVLPIKVKGVQLAEIPNVPASLSGAIAGGTAGAGAGGLFGGHAGAVGGAVTGALGGAAAPIVRGAISGVRSALDEAAAARAAAAGSIPPDVTVLSPEYFDRLRLPPGPAITPPPPPPESYVRSVPAMYPTGPNPARALPAPPTVITPEAPPVPPDTSFVRSVPAQYPEIIPPTLRANTAAADLAGQLESSMRVETIADYLARNKIPNSMLETFGDNEWKMIADQAGVRPPSPENIQAIRGNLAEYEAAATQPVEAGKMAPAEAKADFEQRRAARARRKPPAAATEPAPAAPGASAVPEAWRGAPPAEGGAVAPTAAELRIEKLAQHLAAEKGISVESLAGLVQQPEALLQFEKLAKALGEARPAPTDIPQIIERVRQLRAR